MSLTTNILLSGYDYELRTILDFIFKYSIIERLRAKGISNNIFMKEKETDILYIETSNIDNKIIELKDRGYQESSYDDYVNEYTNGYIKKERTDTYSLYDFNNELTVNNFKFSYSFKDNVVNFNTKAPYELFCSIEYEFNLKLFFIDNEGFVYILTDDNVFIKSHINLNFYKEENHKCITKLEDIECLYKFKIDDVKGILYIDEFYIYYLDNDSCINKLTLGKKYYFIKDDILYYNALSEYPEDKLTIQIEHLHMYDWLSLLGLNKFEYKDKKISSHDIDSFKDIFNFKFDSTLNGLLNYKNFGSNKSYKVNKDINFVKIVGNFNYKYSLGKYKIRLSVNKSSEDTEANIHIELLKDNKCLKSINGNTVGRILYFCNLKFIFYKEFYDSELIEFDVDVTDKYSVKINIIKRHIDENDNINDFNDIFRFSQSFRRDSIKHQLIETDFENGHFIIKNYIKSSKERAFTEDFKIKFIEKDGTPSMLWGQIKNKDYFLRLKNYLVQKIIKPKKHESELFYITNKEFSLDLDKILNKTEVVNENN